MPRRISHDASYPCSPAELHAALTDPAYWRARVDAVGGPGATLDDVRPLDGGVEVALTQKVAAEHLPSIVSKIVSGDLSIARTEAWGPLEGSSATGRTTAQVASTPAFVGSTAELSGDSDGCTVCTRGEVKVSVPLIGGRLEQAVSDAVLRLLQAEQKFTASWVRH
ncbi:MAG: DUF2505 domain-containing protein [Mycobacteriaceae bacterium]